jgi:allophanate hydrolase
VVELFVVGAHLSGQPLAWQLADRGSTLAGAARTAREYRLVALGTEPPKPGLVRVGAGGASIEGERWLVPVGAFGSFVAGIPSPLAIGKVALDDGSLVCGFLCESWAADVAEDITAFGGWRSYLASVAGPPGSAG